MKVHVKHAMHNKAVSYCKQRTWCRRGDSNPHELPHTPLKRARLPVPPLRHEVSLEGSAIIAVPFSKTATCSQRVMLPARPVKTAAPETVWVLPPVRFQVLTATLIASHSGSATRARAQST
jgi:hypothetical protein